MEPCHDPSHRKPASLRNAFHEAIVLVHASRDGEPEPEVEVDDNTLKVSVLSGRFWHYSTLMPNRVINALQDLAGDIDLPACRPTFAAGAQQLRRMIAMHAAYSEPREADAQDCSCAT